MTLKPLLSTNILLDIPEMPEAAGAARLSAPRRKFTGFVATTTLSAASHANRSRCLIKCAKESARYPGDYHPRKRHGIRRPLQLPFARQAPPIEQLARQQSMSSCRCRDLPGPLSLSATIRRFSSAD